MKEIEPPNGLCRKILLHIQHIQRRIARIKLGASATAMAVTALLAVPVFEYAFQEFSQSGFFQYFSLQFSDSEIMLFSWKEFILSLAESLPSLGIAAVFMTVFVLLGSVLLVSKNMKNAFLHIQHIF